MDKRDLANWIVRLNAKGEALKAGRGSPGQPGDGLRRVALVTCAKSVAEVQLFRQQSAAAALAVRSRSRSSSGSSNGGGGSCFSGGNGGGERRQRLKRLHSASFSSDSLSSGTGSSGPDGGAASGSPGSSCNCDSCSLCSKYQAAGANSCYCRAIGYTGAATAATNSSGYPAGVAAAPPHLLSDDEESKLIDEFLTSLDGVPSNKKCKRL